jgi:DNA-binding CsgD family transcriptional regulator
MARKKPPYMPTFWTINLDKFLAGIGLTMEQLMQVRERHAALTPREAEVFHLMGQFLTNRGIAHGLGISTKTLDIHRATICRKLGFKRQAIYRSAVCFQLLQTTLDYAPAPEPTAATEGGAS